MHARPALVRVGARVARSARDIADLQHDAALALQRAWRFGRGAHAPPAELTRLQGLAIEHRRYRESLERVSPSLCVVGGARHPLVLVRARVVFAMQRGWRAVLGALAQGERNLAAAIQASALLDDLDDDELVLVVASMLSTSTAAAFWLKG